MLPVVPVLGRESVDNPLGPEMLSEVLGKLDTAVTELGSIFDPVEVTRDKLRSLRDPDSESVGGARDGVTGLDIRVVKPEVRDTSGKVTDVLGTFENEFD